ncbi:hypothetical protein AVV36_gp164 [Pectobacterium bacteriophage PM2]|uniref:Uncharacterized protein n=1 Tax=Pectobacterium bacteriophage PM2 TaxID=1429794 RepID=A0A0A0Q0T0_9CAUD|nr:hypothetical protein AVV36_gp164 [Pectobacterium bacteriophage PM2]AHY25246.1 hypothetical protein PM2_284 [Pectobacterium bacteriophage PM2]
MFFDAASDTYIHVWGVETATPVVKMNIKDTKRQKKLTGKKQRHSLNL